MRSDLRTTTHSDGDYVDEDASKNNQFRVPHYWRFLQRPSFIAYSQVDVILLAFRASYLEKGLSIPVDSSLL